MGNAEYVWVDAQAIRRLAGELARLRDAMDQLLQLLGDMEFEMDADGRDRAARVLEALLEKL